MGEKDIEEKKGKKPSSTDGEAASQSPPLERKISLATADDSSDSEKEDEEDGDVGGASGSGSGSGGGRASQKAQSSSGNRHRPSSGLKLHEGNRERSSSINRQNQQQSSLATPSSPVATEQPTTPTSPASPTPTTTTPGIAAGINTITSSAPPTAVSVANGDVPLVDGAVQGPTGPALSAASGGGGGGVMSMSGKKQATVRAVPRVDQPATTAQDKVSQYIVGNILPF